MQARQIDPFFYRVFVLVGMVVFLYLIYLLLPVLLPFIAAFVLAYIVNPLAEILQKRLHFRRWVAILMVYLSFAFLLSLVLWWLIPLIWEQLQAMWKYLPSIIDYYNNTVREWVTQHSPIKLPKIQVKDMSVGMVEFLKTNYNISDAPTFFGQLFLSGRSVINIAGLVVLVPILAFYFLINWHERLENWQILIPRRYYPTTMHIARESDTALKAFIKGQFLVMVLLGIIYAVQLQVIGLNVGLIIGMVAGLASFVPYLGFTIGFLAAMVAGFFQFGLDWTHLGLIIGAFMVGQAIEGYVLQPLLLGDKIGLSALWVMFAVLAGATLLGITGMLIALPIAAVLNVICRHIYQAYLSSDFYKGHPQLDLFSGNNFQQLREEAQAKETQRATEEANKQEQSIIEKVKDMF